MKSQCCNANIEELKSGEGFLSPTTGAYICSACKKYCVRKKDMNNFANKIKKILNKNGKEELKLEKKLKIGTTAKTNYPRE